MAAAAAPPTGVPVAGGGPAAASGGSAGHKPCYTCQVRFPDAASLAAHFGSQWHQYNVKRASETLPPVTLAGFERKKASVLAARASAAATARPRKFKCTLTGKVFNSLGQLQTHYASKKVRGVIKKRLAAGSLAEDPLAGVDVSALCVDQLPHCVRTIFLDEEAPTAPAAPSDRAKAAQQLALTSTIHDTCFLDLQPVASLTENLARLVDVHGLVIPDIPYLADLPGLLAYCHEKVLKGHCCLYCSAPLADAAATVQHMADKGHAKFPFDVHAGDPMVEYERFYDFEREVTVRDSEGREVTPLSRADRRYDEHGNLVLPDGASVGHRAYAQYYVQKLHTPRESDAVAAARREGTQRQLRRFLGAEAATALVAATHAGAGGGQALSTYRDQALFRAKSLAQKAAERGRTEAVRARQETDTAVGTSKVKAKKRYFVQQYMGAG